MIVKFEFNLPEDQRDYRITSQAHKMQTFLWDYGQQLRSWYKYGHTFKDADDALYKMREEFYRLINENQINIDL